MFSFIHQIIIITHSEGTGGRSRLFDRVLVKILFFPPCKRMENGCLTFGSGFAWHPKETILYLRFIEDDDDGG